MRQIPGVFAQLEKARLIGKLKAARDRNRTMRSQVVPFAIPPEGS
jgi:hypothetical protein